MNSLPLTMKRTLVQFIPNSFGKLPRHYRTAETLTLHMLSKKYRQGNSPTTGPNGDDKQQQGRAMQVEKPAAADEENLLPIPDLLDSPAPALESDLSGDSAGEESASGSSGSESSNDLD
jgi:hypothetical protein